jgi:hypothetical protein
MLRQLVAPMRTARRSLSCLLDLGLSRLVLRRRNLLRQGGRKDEIRHLAKRHLHLIRVDALALVLSTEVPLDALELEEHQLVELSVLVPLVVGARELRFELGDARGLVAHEQTR